MTKVIIVIDDEQGIREQVAEILELEGYEAFATANGREGLEMIDKTPPDLVITDLMMPELSGFDVIRQLRQQSSTAHIPVLVISGSSVEVDVRELFALGADKYLSKPFDTTQLIKSIEELLA